MCSFYRFLMKLSHETVTLELGPLMVGQESFSPTFDFLVTQAKKARR